MSEITLPTHWVPTAAPPLTQAILRSTPEDFFVEELMPIELSGAGEHVWLRLRKRGMNTDFTARLLARIAGVPQRTVSYAGMKDRHAVAVQWFSVQMPGRDTPDFAAALPEEIEVLEVARHARKLQRGALSGNRFEITLRACVGDRAAALRRCNEIATLGVPNYFGEQRFGRDNDNLRRAHAMFGGARVGDAHLRGIYLSAARAALFNDVLAERIHRGTWGTAISGEAFVLNGSNSFFVQEIDDTLRLRIEEGDIHPSGPLWGRGELATQGMARILESEVAARHAASADGLARMGLSQERRALRLIPRGLDATWRDTDTLHLRFELPSGTYATAVLRELATYRDAQGGGIA
jgi:tRNA pseudouridine13 synthase